MNENALADMETLFMGLADKTRLRLLNLMRDEEVCVCFFTEVLGDSQPKISRHLAYLRNAGIVTVRREGKWAHYSIARPEDERAREVLRSVLDWLDSREDLRIERQRYKEVCCSPDLLVQIARSPMPFISAETDVYDEEPVPAPQRSHNELEEFLL